MDLLLSPRGRFEGDYVSCGVSRVLVLYLNTFSNTIVCGPFPFFFFLWLGTVVVCVFESSMEDGLTTSVRPL